MRSTPPIAKFFMNMTICIWCIMGSGTVQNLCIIGVTPDEKQRNGPSAEPGSRGKQVNLGMLEG
jgi:hypothetical protein